MSEMAYLIVLFAFWWIAPGATFLVALIALTCVTAALWRAGKEPA